MEDAPLPEVCPAQLRHDGMSRSLCVAVDSSSMRAVSHLMCRSAQSHTSAVTQAIIEEPLRGHAVAGAAQPSMAASPAKQQLSPQAVTTTPKKQAQKVSSLLFSRFDARERCLGVILRDRFAHILLAPWFGISGRGIVAVLRGVQEEVHERGHVQGAREQRQAHQGEQEARWRWRRGTRGRGRGRGQREEVAC